MVIFPVFILFLVSVNDPSSSIEEEKRRKLRSCNFKLPILVYYGAQQAHFIHNRLVYQQVFKVHDQFKYVISSVQFDSYLILTQPFSLVQKHIRKGVIGPTLKVEELGRRKVNHGVRTLSIYMS